MRVLKALIGMLILAVAMDGRPSDGVLEINQACALNGGCFPGDSAGFPVTISSPGSYQLTGNLDLSDFPNKTAIEAQVPAINLDLNGFEIAGPITCTGSGSTISCSPAGGGHGVEVWTASVASSVRNGTIRGMGGNGVSGNPSGLRVHQITAIHNAGDGIAAILNTMITECVAIENQGDGVDVDAGSLVSNVLAIGNGINGIEIDGPGGVLDSSTSRGNGADGFWLASGTSASGVAAFDNTGNGVNLAGTGSVLGAFGVRANGKNGVLGVEGSLVVQLNASGNSGAGLLLGEESKIDAGVYLNPDNIGECGGGICSHKRRYYLSLAGVSGGSVLSTCANGFHTASLWEIWDTSLLAYDSQLGRVSDDSGGGPPSNRFGWIRSGNVNAQFDPELLDPVIEAGILNCEAWTSFTPGHKGTSARPNPVFYSWLDSNNNRTFKISPWESQWEDCAGVLPVWCVED